MLIVSTPADTTALTTLVAVKEEMKIVGGADDAWLRRQIDGASALACAYLGVPMANDGTANLGRETVVETIRLDRGHPRRGRWDVRRHDLRLARWPISSVTSVEEAGTVLDAAAYEMDVELGALTRLSGGAPSFWAVGKIVITYVAGWLLPGDEGRNLPPEIEDAVIELVKASVFGRSRDPAIKSEQADGIDSVTYFFGTPGEGPMPASVVMKLDRYRNY